MVSQGCCSTLYKSPLSPLELCRGPCVKSPLCKADRGLSICKPAWEGSISPAVDLVASDISSAGSKGEELEGLGDGFCGV